MFRVVLASLLTLLTAAALAQPSATSKYFEGLRERGLFDLAEGEALRRFALPESSPEERATLVEEFARTLAEHAKFAQGPEQADLWRRAESAIVEFLKSHADYRGRIRLEVLRGELSLSQGEALRWLATLAPEEPRFATEARKALDVAVGRLTASEKTLDRRLRNRLRGRTDRTEPLTPAELSDLLTRSRLSLGLAELERARLAEGQERSARVASAERWLEGIAKGAESDASTWKAQIGLAETALLTGHHDLVRRRLASLKTSTPPPGAKDAAAAISAELLLDENKPDRAVAFLIDYRKARGSMSGELRVLQVQGIAAAAAEMESLGREDEAAALREQIPTIVRWSEVEQGGYWTHRVRLAARQAERAARYGSEIAERLRQAEAALASGSSETAIEIYEEAANLAADDLALSAELLAARASLLLRSERFDEAAATFFAVAGIEPDREKAAEAHLLSAYALGRSHDDEPTAARREAYVARLEEHRTQYAAEPTAAEATLRLARLFESRRQYSKALPLYQEITSDPRLGQLAVTAMTRNYENLLVHLGKAHRTAATKGEAATRGRQIEEWSAAAIRDLTPFAESLLAEDARSTALTAAQAEFALRFVRILMNHTDETAISDQLIDRIAESTAADHPVETAEYWNSIRRSVLPLRVVSLAQRNRYEDALGIVDALASAPVADLLAVVRGLSDLNDPNGGRERSAVFGAADGSFGPRLSDLRRMATELLAERRSELSPEELRQFDLVLARANLVEGRSDTAIDRYEAALAARPKDKALLIQAATALLDSSQPTAVTRALEYWRRVEALETPGSEGWLRARLKVIEANVALGKTAEARKLLTVTKLLHPHLGGEEMTAAFEAIQRRLGGVTANPAGAKSR